MWLLGRKENVKEMAQCLEFYYVWGGFLFDAKLLFKILRKKILVNIINIYIQYQKSKSTYFCSILRYYFLVFPVQTLSFISFEKVLNLSYPNTHPMVSLFKSC